MVSDLKSTFNLLNKYFQNKAYLGVPEGEGRALTAAVDERRGRLEVRGRDLTWAAKAEAGESEAEKEGQGLHDGVVIKTDKWFQILISIYSLRFPKCLDIFPRWIFPDNYMDLRFSECGHG